MKYNPKFRFLSIILVLAVFFTTFLPTNRSCFAETNPQETYASDIQDHKEGFMMLYQRYNLLPQKVSVALAISVEDAIANTNNIHREVMVWISELGKKFHTDASCSKMKNPEQITIEKAKTMGYKPCKKCAKGY